MRKRPILILAIIVLLVAAGVGGWLAYKHFTKDTSTDASSSSKAVSKAQKVHVDTFGNKVVILITESKFAPKSVTIKANSDVEWQNLRATPHQVVTDDDTTITSAKSPVLSQGESFTFTFKKPGTYTYHDKLHPDIKGTVKVE